MIKAKKLDDANSSTLSRYLELRPFYVYTATPQNNNFSIKSSTY